jgi:hypothetical protein
MMQSNQVKVTIWKQAMNSQKTLIALILTPLLLIGCGGGGSDNAPSNNTGGGGVPTTDPAVLTSYISSTDYSASIVGCIADDGACTLETLPLVGMVNDAPTVDQIMNQLVVSHSWMGVRFREMLSIMPAEMLLLFRAVTAVVISSDIRPSHYRPGTGAIYLDPALLWQTNQEKATIGQDPDFRSNFGKDLQFIRVWRFVIGGENAWQSYSLTGNAVRTLNDTKVAFSWLLYHELAHANDCASPQNWASFDQTQTFGANSSAQMDAGTCVFQLLDTQMGLLSQTWLGLAQVFYQGADSNQGQRNMTAIEAGDAFAADHAHDAYSYSSQREDVAMAFEAAMMKKHFNADRDMAIIPQFTDFSCDNAGIKWGQRGRMAVPEVLPRTQFVTERILPTVNFDSFYQNLTPAIDINFDHNWCLPQLGQARTLVDNMDAKRIEKQTVDQINWGYQID